MRLRVVCVDQAGQHGVHRMQRAGSDAVSDQFGDQREVPDTVTGDAATAKFLGYQHAGPPEFGRTSPPIPVEGGAAGV